MKSDEFIIFMFSYFVWFYFFVDEIKEGVVIVYDFLVVRE